MVIYDEDKNKKQLNNIIANLLEFNSREKEKVCNAQIISENGIIPCNFIISKDWYYGYKSKLKIYEIPASFQNETSDGIKEIKINSNDIPSYYELKIFIKNYIVHVN